MKKNTLQVISKRKRWVKDTEEHWNSQIENKPTMSCLKSEKTNRQVTVHKKQHRKLKTKQHEPHLKLGWSQVLRTGKQIPTCGVHRDANVITNPVNSLTWSVTWKRFRYTKVCNSNKHTMMPKPHKQKRYVFDEGYVRIKQCTYRIYSIPIENSRYIS